MDVELHRAGSDAVSSCPVVTHYHHDILTVAPSPCLQAAPWVVGSVHVAPPGWGMPMVEMAMGGGGIRRQGVQPRP